MAIPNARLAIDGLFRLALNCQDNLLSATQMLAEVGADNQRLRGANDSLKADAMQDRNLVPVEDWCVPCDKPWMKLDPVTGERRCLDCGRTPREV
ncbi:MAG TPA: hypothetical protein DDY78_03810 [Planctomycetales bacterium]|jgi:hypothetical protein|nr:hypothetical protein [Planctomycetales bacterium]